MKNLEGVFKVVNKFALKGKNVLLVDDVFTTGATANAVCKELQKAKPAKVYVLTAGKTLNPQK